MKSYSTRNVSILSLLAAAGLVSPVVHSASLYWDGDQSIVNNASDNTSGAAMNWLSGGNWDNGTTSAAKATWTSGDIAIFGGTPVSQQTVTLSSGIQCGGMTIGNNYKISITGTGFNQLGNPSGAITINAGGILSADAASNNAHNIGTLTLNGGTLTASVTDNVAYGNWIFNAAGSGITVGGSSMSAITAYSIDVQTRTFTVNDAVAGAGTDLLVSANIRLGKLTKDGAGTMELTGANTTTGGFTVNEGTLKIKGPNSKTTVYANGVITIAAGATVTIDRSVPYGLGNAHTAAITNAGTLNWGKYESVSSPLTLNGGTVNVFSSGYGGLYQGAQLYNGNITTQANVNSSVIQAGDAGTDNAIHLLAATKNGGKGVLFTVADGDAADDLLVSAKLVNESGDAGGAAGALTKEGAGTLKLSGANSYTGTTTINGGTLKLGTGGSIASTSTITIAANSSFDVSTAGFSLGSGKTIKGSGSVTTGANALAIASSGIVTAGNGISGSLTVGNLTFDGTATVNIGALSGYTGTPAVNVTGDLVLSGAGGAVTVNLPTDPLPNGTYKLIGHGNVLANLDAFTFIGGPALGARQSGAYVNNPNSVDLVVSGDSPYWTGDLGEEWSTNIGSDNWRLILGGTVTDFIPNDNVLFNDTATGTTIVDISVADVDPVSTTFDNTSLNYTLHGSAGIATGNLVKTGTGSLTINNANSYAGGSTLGGGTVTLGSSTALGVGPVTLNTGTLALNGQSIANALVLGGGTITGNGTLSGVVSGGTLSYDSPGNTLVLSGTNTYSGSTTIAAGTLEIGGAGQLGAGSYAGTISNSGTMIVNASANQILSGAISGVGSLTKSGSGTLTLSVTNSYGGATNINGGTLKLGNASALGGTGAGTQVNATGTLDLNGFSVGAETISLNGGTLGNSGGAEPVLGNVVMIADSHINITGTWINLRGATGTGKLTLNAASAISGVWNNTPGSTYANSGGIEVQSGSFDLYSTVKITGGPVAVGGGTLKTFGGDNISDSLAVTVNGGTWLMNAAETIGSLAGSGGTVNVQGNRLTAGGNGASTIYVGTITGSGGGLTKAGTGAMTLSGANTYTGATNVNAGILAVGANHTLPDVSAISIGNATLDAATFTDTAGTLDVAGMASIQLGVGAALAFSDSSAIDWTGGTLNLTGTFVSGASLRFGTTSSGLTAPQLASISATGVSSFTLDANGYLTAATGFSGWITGTFANGTVDPLEQGPNDDADDDGIPNLLEYAIDGEDPTVAHPLDAFSNNALSFTKRPGTSGLTYAIVESTDLNISDDWTEVSGLLYVNDPTTISYTLTPGTPPNNFIRLEVTQN